MTVGEALREARNAAGISLSVMATRTHYSKPYLSMVETGKRPAPQTWSARTKECSALDNWARA